MTDHAPGFVLGQGFSQEDWDDVCDNPELTAEDFTNAKPFAGVFPDLYATFKHVAAQKAATKVSTTLRLSPEVLDHFRATGKGWQSRIDAALKEWVASH